MENLEKLLIDIYKNNVDIKIVKEKILENKSIKSYKNSVNTKLEKKI